MDQAEFEQKFGYVGRKKQQHGNGRKSKELVKRCLPSGQCCSPRGLAQRAIRLVPIIGWLPRYSPRNYLHCDLITGLTVGIMVVPQGMAYATLAKVAPVYGLYSCFFAAFFYMFFGTSPHVSIGTFAVASMMVGNVRSELVPDPVVNGLNGTGHEEPVKGPIDFGYPVTPIMLTSALTIGVGICQLLMALCRLSFLTNYISDPLVSGFTTGAAIHVLTSQMEKLIGIKIKSYHGPGMIIFMWRDLILKAKNANIWTLCISAVGLAFLSLGRDYVNPYFRRRFRIPFPLELFLVIAAIIFSTLLGFKKNFGVKIVDHVPDGMPLPALPRLDLLPHIWIEAVSISIICYVFVFSLSKIFAKKHKYKVDANQELCAIGICSVLSSFFPVYPFGASLSRSSLCEMTGAKTPLHALFSSALLLVVILWIGPLLEPLPMAILACIVAVSLKPLFLQFKELARLWRISIYDFAIWLVAFAATALLDITYGLAISVLFSIFTVVLKEQWPNFNQMGEAKSGIFRPLNLYTDLSNPTSQRNVQIWRLDAPLHFANAPKLVESVAEICQQIASTHPSDSMTDIKIVSNDSSDLKLHNESSSPQSVSSSDSASDANKFWKQTGGIIGTDPNSSKPLLHQSDTDHGTIKPQQNGGNSSRTSQSEAGTKGTLILDCAAVSHIDAVGVDAIQEMYKDANRLGVALKFAAFSDSLLAIFHRCSLFQQVPEQNFYPSIQDALTSTIL